MGMLMSIILCVLDNSVLSRDDTRHF